MDFHNGCLRQMMGLHRGPDGPSTAELLARKPNDVMVKQLLFAHSIPGHPRPLGRPHLTWMVSFEQCFILFCSFPLLFAFGVGGLGFEFCVFVAGWRHALRSEYNNNNNRRFVTLAEHTSDHGNQTNTKTKTK